MKIGAYSGSTFLALAVALLGSWGCGAQDSAPAHGRPSAVADSPVAEARVRDVRARFLLHRVPSPEAALGLLQPRGATTVPYPVLGASVATGFELDDDHARALIPADARRGVSRTASVALPVRASDSVRLEDDGSHVAIGFSLRGANDTTLTTAGGVAMYPGALAGADVLHRVHAEGTEDYVVFEQRPRREEIAYDVDVSRVAGLRLVSNTLEFLDDGGSPRLRVAPPYVVDAKGARSEGVLSVEGCAFDASPRAPWGRAVTSPGASRCSVRVEWKAASYPAIVDPSWTSTGSLASPRSFPTATLLGSGSSAMVLVAGGYLSGALTSAELYKPAAGTPGTFAKTGSMGTARWYHTATALVPGTEAKVLVAGGIIDHAPYSTPTAELYDPSTGVFAYTTGFMTTWRAAHTATLLAGGEVLIAGGQGTPPFLSSAELYSPTAGTFSETTGSMATAREGHTATALTSGPYSGEVLLAGGENASGTLSNAELFDPTAGTFMAAAAMTTARYQFTATLLGSGEVLLAGGCGSAYVSGNCAYETWRAELYDPVAAVFSPTASVTTPRAGQTATLLATGKVLMAGGAFDANGNATSSAELYDPEARTFTAAGSMTVPRFFAAATLLGSGEVLVAGGWDSQHGPVWSSVELFNPAGDGGRDAGLDSGDSGLDSSADSGIHRDSGMGAQDSGQRGEGGQVSPGQSGGCGCRVAQRQDAPWKALLWLVAFGALGICRRYRRSTAGFHHRPLALAAATRHDA